MSADFRARRPPEKSLVHNYVTGTNHSTVAIPAALKDKMVTIHAYTQDAFILFGSITTASELAVDRAAAPTNAAASGLGLKLEKDHPDGYRFFISSYFTHMSLEASGTGSVVMYPSSNQM